MKKREIIIAVFLIISILGGAVYYLLDAKQRGINEDFYIDVICTLNTSYECGRLLERLKAEEITMYELCYEYKEGLSNAKDRMKRWKSDKNTLRRDVGRGILRGIDDLLVAAEECVKIISEPTEKHASLFKIKLREGRTSLLVFTILISVPEGPKGNLRLSKSQKEDLKDTIEFYFKKDFAKHKIDPERTSISIEAYPTELIAVVGIYRYLSE